MVTADITPNAPNPSQSRNDAIQICLNSASLIIAIIMLLLKVNKCSGKVRRTEILSFFTVTDGFYFSTDSLD
jgi:hypothetical protein